MIPAVREYIESVTADFNTIAEGRTHKLAEITGFVRRHINSDRTAYLIFICTHNFRHSHMGQIWAQPAAHF